jgi:hypothetical protein
MSGQPFTDGVRHIGTCPEQHAHTGLRSRIADRNGPPRYDRGYCLVLHGWFYHLPQRRHHPHLKSIFELTYAEAMLVQFAFFSSYFVFSYPGGKVAAYRRQKQRIF